MYTLYYCVYDNVGQCALLSKPLRAVCVYFPICDFKTGKYHLFLNSFSFYYVAFSDRTSFTVLSS